MADQSAPSSCPSPKLTSKVIDESPSTSDDEFRDTPLPLAYRGTREFPGWRVTGITDQRGTRRPFRADALTIRMLPIFLPPRDHDAFNDWSNIPLETAHTPLPTLHHPFQSIVPTFWACSTSTSRVSPQDASTLRLLVYLLRNWLEAMELVWDVSRISSRSGMPSTVFLLSTHLSLPYSPMIPAI